MKKTTIILGALFMMLNLSVYSQTGGVVISDNGGGTADPHAVLDIQSSTKGFLLPRMSFATMTAMPATTPLGMMVIVEGTGDIYWRSSNTGWSPIVDAGSFAIGNLSDAQSNPALTSYYIGHNSGVGFSDAVNFTTAVGNGSGVGFGTGDKNTAIGAEAGPASGTTNLHHTTTLGYNSKANFSHQVVLGTNLETVIIPNKITIEPQYTPPLNSERGTLYVETADSNLYYYNGAGWDQINPRKYRVGDIMFGGVVCYVDETGRHGLACSSTDVDPAGVWAQGSGTHLSNAQADGIYTGEMNTALIIATEARNAFTGCAALSCAVYVTNSPGSTADLGGWYLPSIVELQQIYDNKAGINAALLNIDSSHPISDVPYWSSVEVKQIINHAYNFNMGTEAIEDQPKTNVYHVRAVKKF